MSNWIFVVTNQKDNDTMIKAREILETRVGDGYWGLGERTPNRKNLKAGDRVVFYVGHPECVFAGTARLLSSSFEPTEEEQVQLTRGREFYRSQFGVRFGETDVWKVPVRAQGVVSALSFVENKQFWGAYLQGGLRGISDEDYAVIISEGARPEVVLAGDTTDMESVSEFALEAHLEEFISVNWERIPWGRRLRLYETPDSSGRQFSAGTWSIDFLAVDEKTKDFVVIELKRGQTSDATIGQVLRYMEWVRENLAEEDQSVNGLIVCRAVDEALRLAVRAIPNVSVLTYKVDFELRKADL